MKKGLLFILVLLLIGGGIFLIQSRAHKSSPTDKKVEGTATKKTPTPTELPKISASPSAEISVSAQPSKQTETTNEKVITIEGGNFSFSPNQFTVNKGDKVKIIFKNKEGFHDWKIDELKVATKRIKAGAEDTVEFTADQTGQFEYYCSVGSHRQLGMHGTLTVK